MRKPSMFTAGWQFGLGVACAWMIAVAIFSLAGHIIRPFDDCDGNGERCGMAVRTDHLTGLQYLEAQGGGITPRLDREGRHIREGGQ